MLHCAWLGHLAAANTGDVSWASLLNPHHHDGLHTAPQPSEASEHGHAHHMPIDQQRAWVRDVTQARATPIWVLSVHVIAVGLLLPPAQQLLRRSVRPEPPPPTRTPLAFAG